MPDVAISGTRRGTRGRTPRLGKRPGTLDGFLRADDDAKLERRRLLLQLTERDDLELLRGLAGETGPRRALDSHGVVSAARCLARRLRRRDRIDARHAEPAPRSLGRSVVQDTIAVALIDRTEPVARFARDLLARIRELSLAIRSLEREIETLVRDLAAALLALPGCGALTAAKVVGETAGVGRFRSKEAFARHNGTAPVPVWSGDATRHRLSRGGNRQLNAALHRIAITQIRVDERGRAYLDHRRQAGDTKTEAIRALRRRISDEVFRRLQADEAARAKAPAATA